MTKVLMMLRSILPLVATGIGIGVGGCTRDVRNVIHDSLAGGDPARADAAVGVAPVPPEALAIAPTGVPPTRTSAIEPDLILPTMDEVYTTRRLPAGADRWTRPATRPADHEGPPEGQYQPDRPSGR